MGIRQGPALLLGPREAERAARLPKQAKQAELVVAAMFGPIFQLKWLGLLCPCIQKEEQRTARQALQYLDGRPIKWIRSEATKNKGGFSFGISFGKSFLSSSKPDSGGGDCHAIIRLSDNVDGHAEIIIDPTSSPLQHQSSFNENDASNTVGTPSATNSPAPSFQLHIKLSRVDRVTLDGSNDIVLLARPVRGNNKAKELVRFIVLNQHDNCVAKAEERNLFQHHLAVLVEWERQRRAANDIYDDDDDEEDQPNFLQARAAKAAHFAAREVEMKQTKMSREKRKAKLVAESGGLRYTALALASRTNDS